MFTSGPFVLMMDMIQGGNRMVFVLEGTVENFSQIFSLENFQIFCVEREIFAFLNIGNNSPLWKGGRGEKYLVLRFF